MKTLSDISLKVKVPAVITTLCVLTAIAIGLSSYNQFRATLLSLKSEKFEAGLSAKKVSLQNYFGEIERNLLTMARDPSTATALAQFSEAWAELGDNPERTLQDLYIHSNPNPVGEKHRLSRADDTSFYSIVHADTHPYFAHVIETYGYHDIFLIDPEGNLVYSTFKQLDYATNFQTGIFAGSGLGQAFQKAKATAPGAVTFVDYSLYAPSAGAPASFFATPVYDAQGDAMGVLALQLASDGVQAVFDQHSGTEIDRTFLLAPDGTLRSRVDGFAQYGILDEVGVSQDVRDALGRGAQVIDDITGLGGAPVMSAVDWITVGATEWYFVSEGDRARILAPVYTMRNVMLIGGALALVVLTLVGWLLSKTITRPVSALQANMREISNKVYDGEVVGRDRRDEFGQMAKALETLRDGLVHGARLDQEAKRKAVEQDEVVQKLTTALRALSEGDLTSILNEPFTTELEPLRENFNSSLENLSQLVGEVIANCQAISSESTQISREADNLSHRTENQAATLEQTAAALDQLTSGVKQAAESAKEAEGIVNDTQDNAKKGKAIVDEAVIAMNKIEESSNKISEIIGVIDEIAFQTNLLALNAGVEAGRAGEAGRGFAVVASEVGSLSKRSSDAAKEIKKLIADSARQVSKGVEEVTGAGDAITSVVGRVAHISDLMRGIAASAVEQSHSLDEINIGVNQLDQVTQQNAAMVEQSTAASHQLNGKAEQLGQVVRQFRIDGGPTEPARGAHVAEWDDDAVQDAQQAFKSTRSAARPAAAAGGDAMWQNF